MHLLFRLFIAILILSPCTSRAHGYWLEAIGNHHINEPVSVRIFYGDYPAGERLSGKTLDKIKDIKISILTPDGKTQPLGMVQLTDYWEGTFIPQVEGTYQVLGISNEREVQDWTTHGLGITRPIQYLKTFYHVGNTVASHPSSLFLDLSLTRLAGGKYEANITKDYKPFPKATLKLSSYGKEERILELDKKGKTEFSIENDGLYLLSIEWIDKTPGEFRQKRYETVRHSLDFTFLD